MLTQARLKEVLWYDPIVGVFVWKVQLGWKGTIGSFAGSLSKKTGYLRIGIDGKLYYAHRLAWLYMEGEWPEDQIDHINGNKKDNAFRNLRKANVRLNGANQKLRSNNSSGYKGVYFHKKNENWIARIYKEKGEMFFIGSYSDEIEAALAYDEKAREYFGEFARVNFPKEGEAGC